MADFTGIEGSIYSEPEYRTSLDIAAAIYFTVNSDMLGVCPFRCKNVATACRTSPGKMREVVKYFEIIGKLTMAVDNTHICWLSAAFHKVYKGKCSEQQRTGLGLLLKKWQYTGKFGDNFAESFLQLYANKYNLTIPYVSDKPRVTVQSQSYIQSQLKESNSSKVDESTREPKGGADELDLIVKAINFMASKSEVFQTELINNGNLHKKIIDWRDKCSGYAWIMYCTGVMWRRAKNSLGGMVDPFVAENIRQPLSYLYGIVFPQEFDREPDFNAYSVTFREDRKAEWYFRTFFGQDIKI